MPPTILNGSGGAGLAAAGQIGHHSGGDGSQGVGGWLGDADGLEGEESRGSCPCAPRGQESARGIELADGAVAGIRSVEVARGIERQAEWAVQIRRSDTADADICTRRIELADGVGAAIRGVEVARRIERQTDWTAQI